MKSYINPSVWIYLLDVFIVLLNESARGATGIVGFFKEIT